MDMIYKIIQSIEKVSEMRITVNAQPVTSFCGLPRISKPNNFTITALAVVPRNKIMDRKNIHLNTTCRKPVKEVMALVYIFISLENEADVSNRLSTGI